MNVDADEPPRDPTPPSTDGWHDDDVIAVVTTVGSADEARRIGRDLVERRLGACAQITPIESVYVWDGAVQNDQEVRLLVKTVAARCGAVQRAIRERHSYELPAIHAVRLERVHAPYAAWVRAGASGEPVDGAADTLEREP